MGITLWSTKWLSAPASMLEAWHVLQAPITLTCIEVLIYWCIKTCFSNIAATVLWCAIQFRAAHCLIHSCGTT